MAAQTRRCLGGTGQTEIDRLSRSKKDGRGSASTPKKKKGKKTFRGIWGIGRFPGRKVLQVCPKKSGQSGRIHYNTQYYITTHFKKSNIGNINTMYTDVQSIQERHSQTSSPQLPSSTFTPPSPLYFFFFCSYLLLLFTSPSLTSSFLYLYLLLLLLLPLICPTSPLLPLHTASSTWLDILILIIINNLLH